jgi:hypothetical protein
MGYRSQVAIAIHPDKVSEFLAALAASPEALQLCQGYPGHDKGIQTDIFMKGDMFIEMDGIKWYEGYEGIDVIDKFVADTIDEEPNGWEMIRFIRIGEELDDVKLCGEYASEFLCVTPPSIYIEEQL